MRRIWLVGTAMAALIAVPAIDMQAHAASFESTQAPANGTLKNIAPDDALDLACGCGGGEGGGGGGAEGSDGRDGTGGTSADGGGSGSGAQEEEEGQEEY